MTTLLQYRLGVSSKEINELSDLEWAEKVAQLEHIIEQENKTD